jgi:formylglycine-generating enzyme required for sulfatase activity
MGLHTPLNRADILTCVQHYGPAHFEAFAHLLGYTCPSVPEPVPASLPREPEPASMPVAVLQLITALPVAPTQARFYRVVAQCQLTSAEVQREAPPWYREAVPLTLDDPALRADPQATAPPPAPPLMPWSRLWPCLKAALGSTQESASLDVPRLVDCLARSQVLPHLPYLPQQGWATSGQVLLDYAEPLVPFWTDMQTLQERLRRLRGVAGLTLLAFPDGNPEGRCLQWTPRGWQECAHYPLPATGTPVLVLSDLGCLGGTTARRGPWRRLGQRLRHAGCQPVALMPCPERCWQADVISLFAPVCWDRAVRPPHPQPRQQVLPSLAAAENLLAPAPVLSSRPTVDEPPEPAHVFLPLPAGEGRGEGVPKGAALLLSALGAAIRVEPALLRAVRYLLPARSVDVGSEAAAWNHPHVHATPLAFYYAPETIAHYRQAFQRLAQQDLTLAHQIAAILLAWHAHLSPVIGLEERVVLAESGCLPPGEAIDERFLARLVRTLDAGSPAAGPTRAWGLRLEQRQQGQTWQYEKLQAIWLAVHRQALLAGASVTPPQGMQLARWSWLLEPGAVPREYSVRQRERSLVLEADPPPRTGLTASGSLLGRLRAAAPYVLVQPEDGASTAYAQSLTRPIPLPARQGLRLRTDQQELTLESVLRLPWVERMGCDAQGLYIIWDQGQRQAYWVPPGPYAVHTRAGTRLADLVLEQSFWGDAAEALALLRGGFQQPAWAADYGQDTYGLYADVHVAGVTQRLRWIAPGEFDMGSPEDEPGRYKDETRHRVLLTCSYWLADTACTQALWWEVMSNNPSHFKGVDRPVEYVSWEAVQAFLQRLNSLVPEQGFRLPTEAEWEYACRAGTTTPFWFGTQITPEQVNYDGHRPYAGVRKGLYRGETVPVQELPCNGWGLYQMHGNVWEWCQDWHSAYTVALDTSAEDIAAYTAATSETSAVDPTGPDRGDYRVLRGGGWLVDGRDVRLARCFACLPAGRSPSIGFCLARGQALGQPGPEAMTEQLRGRVRQTTRSGGG